MNTLGTILQKFYLVFGLLAIALTSLFGILAAITTFISKAFLIQVLQSMVSPFLTYLLGASESAEKIAYLIILIKFSPFIISLVMLLGSIIVSVIATLPDLCSAYCISSDSEWLPVVMGIAVVKNIALFPIGTILSLLSIIYLIGYLTGNTGRTSTK
jgi:hypothetical protein